MQGSAHFWGVLACMSCGEASKAHGALPADLLQGTACRDMFSNARSAPDTAISVEYNGGFSGALAMLAAKEWVLTCGSRPGLIDRAGGHLQHSVW